MVEISYQLSGVDAKRWHIARGSSYRTPVTVRQQSLELPGRHGVINAAPTPVFDEPQLTFIFKLQPGTGLSIEEAQAELVSALTWSRLTVTRTVDGQATTAAARLVSIASANYLPGLLLEMTAIIALPGVFWRGDQVTSAAYSIPATGSLNIPELGGSTAPINDLVIRVTGPATAIQLRCPVSGTGITWAGSGLTGTSSGTYLYLAPATMTAWRTSGAGMWEQTGGTDVSSGLDYLNAGILETWPNQNNQIRLRTTGSGLTTASRVAVRGQAAYL